MAYSQDKVISVAKAEIGYLEKKSNKDLNSKTANAGSKNYTKYGAWYGDNPDYWCAMFVCWCFAQAYGSPAKDILCGGYSAACETMRARFVKAGRYNKEPQAGDCIFFTGTRHAGANHIGIVWKVDGSKIYTIEGNTSGANGVIDNGGGVAQKSYSKSYSRIMGYGHPKFDVGGSATNTTTNTTTSKPTTTTKPASTSSSSTSKPSKSNKIDVDGEWGKATTRAAQRVFCTTIDGIVSRQIAKYKKYMPNCLSSSWEFKSSGYHGGSELIKAIQKWCGTSADGLCGPGTIKALQKKLGVSADGYMGPKTVKAFQTYLNKYL